MLQQVLGILLPILVCLTALFILVRFRAFTREPVAGKAFLISGAAFLLAVATWQAVKTAPAYSDWFLESAYAFLDLIQFGLLVIGLYLVAVGAYRYAGFRQAEQEGLRTQSHKLSLLDDLQREGRQPYQLLDLLSLCIKAVVTRLPESAAAVFLLNRTRRQFVLASAVGLTKDETSALEYYPLERNVVSQAIDLAEPLLAGSFDFGGTSRQPRQARFNSCLVLPLVSGTEKLGGIILLSEQEHYFGNPEIKLLSPVAEWLAEKIKSARLTRELTSLKTQVEQSEGNLADLLKRFTATVRAFGDTEPMDAFCRALSGAAGCQSVHLYGSCSGSLSFYGGSEAPGRLSEGYRTALIEALGRERPLVINQEAAAEDGRAYVASSSLVIPLPGEQSRNALLLRSETGPFSVAAGELKTLETYAHLAALLLEQTAVRRAVITRRRGLQAVLRLLRFDTVADREGEWTRLSRMVSDLFPEGTTAVVLAQSDSGTFKKVAATPAENEALSRLSILPGEGPLTAVAGDRPVHFTQGSAAVAAQLDRFESANRELLYSLFTPEQMPTFLAACFITDLGETAALLLIFFDAMPDQEQEEWQRLLTLLTGLLSMRLSIAQLLRWRQTPEVSDASQAVGFDRLVNQLNNHLSGIIGNAELAESTGELPQSVRLQIENIIAEAESAAEYLRSSLGGDKLTATNKTATETTSINLSELVRSVLDNTHISENVYMLDGRPRDLELLLNADDDIEFSNESVRSLFEGALSRLVSAVSGDDVITVATYRRGRYVYLDVSRHQKNLPAVEPVAGFGEYVDPGEALSARPDDTYLAHLIGSDWTYSFDRFGQAPTYLSFRFPLTSAATPATQQTSGGARVLAIDDQPVILDLILAMCQSLELSCQTASSGEEGIKLAFRTSFDIVLTDLAMPGMSGLEVARRLRQTYPRLPIILITGWEASLPQSELDAGGITDVLYKPFRIEQLTEMLRSALALGSVS